MKINYAAVAVSAVIYWMLGGLWYSPLLFGGKFIEIMRWSPEQLARIEREGAAAQLALTFFGSLVASYVLAHVVRYTSAESAKAGAKAGLWLWLGFVVTTNLNTVFFEFRPISLYLINISYHLVALLSMGALLAVWRKKRGVAKAPAYV
ncbi:MAG TPA: DUF1761 domain-containing protein [Pyrinomonadaceae bacterium]|nr:DUF1761 domain-containing protein [Pyrinomonadaceae bacterium]